jgi:hypothetical protein
MARSIAGVAYVDRADLHIERRCHGLDCAELADASSDGRIAQDRHSGRAGCDLLEQLQPFPTHAVLDNREPGGVATWPRQAFDEAAADWVGGIHEDDRHCAGQLQQRCNGNRSRSQDNVWHECD